MEYRGIDVSAWQGEIDWEKKWQMWEQSLQSFV